MMMMVMVMEGLYVDKNPALCETLVEANNPRGKMSFNSMVPLVKR